MNTPIPKLPKINDKERTPLVGVLLEIIAKQSEEIDKLEQKILKLKGETTKPKISPSQMDKNTDPNVDEKTRKPRGPMRSKTEDLRIDEIVDIRPDNIPEGAEFKGYREVVIQDIVIKSFNTCYKLAQYRLSDGSYLSGKLPEHLQGCHFGSDLIRLIQYQNHYQLVTQPLLLDFLHDLGVEISAGQVNKFLNLDIEVFHQEKEEILAAGLKSSSYIHTDDTTARHNGKNGNRSPTAYSLSC